MSVQSIFEAFNRVRGLLLPAIDAMWTEDEVINELVLGRAQLWAGDRAAVVTRCISPDVFHVWLAGGAMRDVLALIPGGVAWARPMGLKRMTINGRQGWTKVLAGLGFMPREGYDGVLEKTI